MKKTIVLSSLLLMIFAQTYGQNKATIQGDSGKFVINRNIYGHFAEHLGRCIYGGLYVGENNTKIPNTNGVRKDIIDALKKMKIPLLRWPGGCFADTYHWKDGIGPKEKRPSMLNVWWGGVTENNSFGTHDFLNMCKEIQAEPYLAGNVGSGTVQELADWVKYVNYQDKSCPMANLRAENGQIEPWDVKYWGVGNEAWGCGGNMQPEYYANIYRQYATYMTNWDNSHKIFRIASGASDDNYQWTEVLMRDIPKNMFEGIAVHHYSIAKDWGHKGSAASFDEDFYFHTMKSALYMDDIIKGHAAVMDKHDPQKKIAMVIDEWGGWYDVEPGTNGAFLYQQNTMRDALLAGATLNIFHKYCERVRMANLAQLVNVLQAVVLTNEEKMLLTPTYHVLEMYNVHQDATMLPIELKSNEYSFGNEKLPAISVSASRDAKGVVHISLVNIDINKAQDISLNLKGIKAKNLTGRILASAKIQDHNTFENPEKIKPVAFNAATISGETLSVKLPAASVVVLELK